MATTLGFRRFKAPLIAWLTAASVVAISAGIARAGDWMPLLPDQDFYDFQLFAPPDLQEYEIYPEPSEGIFFSYDRLYWSITPPSVTGVGETENGGYLIPSQPISPQTLVQLNNAGFQGANTVSGSNTGTSVIGGVFIFGADPLQLDLNTSWMRTAMTWGNRYEGGWIYDNRGVALSYYDSGDQNQTFTTMSEFAASSPTQIFVQQASAGGGVGEGGGGGVGNVNQALTTTTIISNSPPPDHLIAQKFVQDNMTRIQSAGAAMIVRRELGRRGSGTTARFAFGPRFYQLEDRFNLQYESNQYAFNQGPTGSGSGQGINIGSSGGAGGAAGGAGAAGTTGSTGSTGGTAATGGAGAGGGFGSGLDNTNMSVVSTSAGDVLGISGVDSLTGQGQGSPLQTGEWNTSSYNNIVGPEFAVLFETNRGRWTFSSELKFTAGLNWQNTLYRGANFPDSIGADYIRSTFNPSVTNTAGSGVSDAANTVQLSPPPLFLQIYGVGQSNATNDVEHNFVFTPIGEWRFGGKFRVSQAVTLHAGYTGLVMGSIARASSNTAYKSIDKPIQYAEVLDPEQPASIDNPWVVKTTGLRPTTPTPGSIYTDPDSPYFRENPVYNRIGPGANDVQDVVFTNGVDFGVEIRY
jgi:hypothetical protein